MFSKAWIYLFAFLFCFFTLYTPVPAAIFPRGNECGCLFVVVTMKKETTCMYAQAESRERTARALRCYKREAALSLEESFIMHEADTYIHVFGAQYQQEESQREVYGRF